MRVPVFFCHAENVVFTTKKKADVNSVKQALSSAPGVILCEKDENFPTPTEVEGKDEVFVGRVRPVPRRKEHVFRLGDCRQRAEGRGDERRSDCGKADFLSRKLAITVFPIKKAPALSFTIIRSFLRCVIDKDYAEISIP